MARKESVINLDPIDRKKQKGVLGRLLVTRYDLRGKKPVKTEPYGHYMFCGKQRQGKTASVLWYTEKLARKYKKRRIGYHQDITDDEGDVIDSKYIRFNEPPKIKVYSNFGIGKHFNKSDVFELIDKFDPYANEIRIVLIDEFHTYFPKGSTRKEDKDTLAKLTSVFSQLGKRNCYVLSTAQVYGRLDKALREQCLYMVNNRISPITGWILSEFILESDILCDDLGRWAGDPRFIYKHGLSKIKYDTKKLIRE